MTSRQAKVAILMGSESDRPVVTETAKLLEELEIGFTWLVRSAHRTPDAVREFVHDAEKNDVVVFIAAAGGAAHLAGAVAAHTTRPVIGIPLAATPLAGFDALLATVQMPPGVPVATVAVGPMGAKNAALLAAQIVAVGDPELAGRLRERREAERRRLLEASPA